jgi:hypothetical protein
VCCSHAFSFSFNTMTMGKIFISSQVTSNLDEVHLSL